MLCFKASRLIQLTKEQELNGGFEGLAFYSQRGKNKQPIEGIFWKYQNSANEIHFTDENITFRMS